VAQRARPPHRSRDPVRRERGRFPQPDRCRPNLARPISCRAAPAAARTSSPGCSTGSGRARVRHVATAAGTATTDVRACRAAGHCHGGDGVPSTRLLSDRRAAPRPAIACPWPGSAEQAGCCADSLQQLRRPSRAPAVGSSGQPRTACDVQPPLAPGVKWHFLPRPPTKCSQLAAPFHAPTPPDPSAKHAQRESLSSVWTALNPGPGGWGQYGSELPGGALMQTRRIGRTSQVQPRSGPFGACDVDRGPPPTSSGRSRPRSTSRVWTPASPCCRHRGRPTTFTLDDVRPQRFR